MSDMVNVHAKYWKMIGDLDRDKTELRERIKQLEKELMEVKNKHSVLVADVVLYEDRADRIKRLEDCAETAWGIIANVDSGSWQEQRADWREAATRWRDKQFHPELSERKAKEAKL